MEDWLRIFAHDEGYGVWGRDNTPLDPDELPISADLRTVLGYWMGLYWDRPTSMTQDQLGHFALVGRLVARAFKTELPSCMIIYHDEAAAARHEEDDGFENFDADPWEYEITEPWPKWRQLLEELKNPAAETVPQLLS